MPFTTKGAFTYKILEFGRIFARKAGKNRAFRSNLRRRTAAAQIPLQSLARRKPVRRWKRRTAKQFPELFCALIACAAQRTFSALGFRSLRWAQT
jgi:hypothetical protein